MGKSRLKSVMSKAAAYAAYYNACPVDSSLILYEAFYGRGMLCNPNGLFHSFMRRPDFPAYVHVWVIEDFEANREIIEEYRDFDNVIFVGYLSGDYMRYLASAKYLINNVMFPPYFVKKEEQVYINTWHGIPLKTLGYDVADGRVASAGIIRNFLSADYLLSPCQYFTDVYKSVFRLEGIYNGKIIEEGQPRNDLMVHADREAVLERMKRNGVIVEQGKKIILYAPTWRGKDYASPSANVAEYLDFIRFAESNVDRNRYQVLVKPHQVVYGHRKEEMAGIGKFVPAVLDANEVLSVTDVLISDYSSIFFDFLASGKPILFYVPDVDSYRDYRGLYLDLKMLPGPVTEKREELARWLRDPCAAAGRYQGLYGKQRERFVPLDDGGSADRIWEVVLDGDRSHHVADTLLDGKIRLLFYIGITRVNGITETFASLLNRMDYDKFDVSVIALSSKNPDEREKLNEINEKARVLVRKGPYCMTEDEQLNNEILLERGISPETAPYYDRGVYRRIWRQHIGRAEFDCVINYTGYSPVCGLMMREAGDAKKFIWQHSDLRQDMKKKVDGKKVNRKVLRAVISTYPFYDKIVSCSRSVMEMNRDNLADSGTYGKFDCCKNTVSFERVISGLNDSNLAERGGVLFYVKKPSAPGVLESAALELVPLPAKDALNFVTVGRLSPEKNHTKLIRAFCRFHEKNKNTRLYILGDGLLARKLRCLVAKRGAFDYIKLLGNVPNPFGIMKYCDCFILPSLFEGQPIVLLEARAVGLPIIVSDFSTVRDSLVPDGQLLTGRSEEDIYNALEAFVKGMVPRKAFNPEEYNKEAYREFETVILGGNRHD